MNFKAYDILSSLIPGFLTVLVMLNVLDMEYDNNLIVPYTAVAFLFGYLMNAISSWMEDIYFFTWGGKPSNRLLSGKDIWKVKFYSSLRAKNLLLIDASNPNATNDELFSIAMRIACGQKDTKVDDFNALYAFSRSLLTTVIIATIFLLIKNYNNWIYYAILIPALIIVWLRCKQRAYYYVREVLNVYLEQKSLN